MYYHGSQTRITSLTQAGDLCLTTATAVAESYARYDTDSGGYLHHIDGDVWLADEDDLREAASAVHGREIDADEHLFMLADDPDVRAHLAAQDYDGVIYGDHDISGADHDCVRVWHTALLRITAVTEIED